jgi:hypothetical protein
VTPGEVHQGAPRMLRCNMERMMQCNINDVKYLF